MNRSGAANVASQARRSAAAMKRASKNSARTLSCPHENTEAVDGLEHCTDCDGYGPWKGHCERCDSWHGWREG